jgi:hypothetical protein
MQNFTFSTVPKYPPHLILSYWIIQLEKEFKLKKCSRARFPLRRPASAAPRPISTREPDLPPVTALPTLTAGTHLSGPSSPKSSLASCPCVVAGEFPATKTSTRRFLLAIVLPLVCLHPGAITSPLG